MLNILVTLVTKHNRVENANFDHKGLFKDNIWPQFGSTTISQKTFGQRTINRDSIIKTFGACTIKPFSC